MDQALLDIRAYLSTLHLPRAFQSRRMRVLLFIIAIMFSACSVLSVSFVRERSQREAEWQGLMANGRRTPAEVRGIMNNMIRNRLAGLDNAPAAIPQSMWDDAACAGAVIAMVNFIMGEDWLTSTSAWTFQRDNVDRVRLIYDREQSGDYFIDAQNEAITETHDRTWWFSRLRQFQTVGEGRSRTSARIYVLGYRYKRTAANRKILQARREPGADQVGLNSHLVLLLGAMDGRWYGYHLFHDPEAPDASPFRVDALDSEYMTSRFDMVRVWEVVGPVLTLNEAPIMAANPARPYTSIHGWLGHANRLGDRVGSIFDTAMMGFFGDSQQFPYISHLVPSRPCGDRRVATRITTAPTTRPVTAPQLRHPHVVRPVRHQMAHVSRRHAPPPRVGARNRHRREGHHAPHTSRHAR